MGCAALEPRPKQGDVSTGRSNDDDWTHGATHHPARHTAGKGRCDRFMASGPQNDGTGAYLIGRSDNSAGDVLARSASNQTPGLHAELAQSLHGISGHVESFLWGLEKPTPTGRVALPLSEVQYVNLGGERR